MRPTYYNLECNGTFWSEVVRKMFAGTFEHSLDEKGRVIIPSKFREGLTDVFYVTLGGKGSLSLYPQPEWEKLKEKLKTSTKITAKDIKVFYANACECELDKQGRTLISSKLREYAGISRDVYINGAANKVEIWDREAWKEYVGEEKEALMEMSAAIEEIDML